jgi:SAM-dependent methyltransferase
VNFAKRTVWDVEGQAARSFVLEATRLDGLSDASYDAVLASHVLEHIANPLRALDEWRRVTRPGGQLLLVVPHRDGTFDHRRELTPLSHLRADERAGVGEDDTTHQSEILSKHDLRRDRQAGSYQAFVRRSRDNLWNRTLHHHVFTTASVIDCVLEKDWEIDAVTVRRPYHIIVLARHQEGPRRPFPLAERAAVMRASPFASDHGSRHRAT